MIADQANSTLGVYGGADLSAIGELGVTFSPSYNAVAVEIGDFNRDLKQEIALLTYTGAPFDPTARNYKRLSIYSFNGTTIAADGRDYFFPYDGQSLDWLALAAADVGGASLRVGPPSYRVVSAVSGIVAVINDPPKHRDIVDGQVIDLYTGREDSSAGYETATGTATTMSLSLKRAWGLQSELSTTVGDEEGTHVSFSLGASYGQDFEQGREQYQAITFGQNIETNLDDALVFSKTEYQVWEYPLYRDTGEPYDYITVVFPVRRSDGTGTVQALDQGNTCESWYAPSHVVGNVWSYYPTGKGPQFPDFDPAQGALKSFSVGGAQSSFSLSWDTVSTTNQARETHMGFSAGFEAQAGGDNIPVFPGVSVKVPFSIKASVSGQYDESSLATHTVQASSTTAISGRLLGLSTGNLYTVEPYVYWAKGGYLVLDYLTGPSAGSAVWSQYNRPDPAFGLPWYGFPAPDPAQAEVPPCGEGRRLFSRDVQISPSALNVGDQRFKVMWRTGSAEGANLSASTGNCIKSPHTTHVLLGARDWGGSL